MAALKLVCLFSLIAKLQGKKAAVSKAFLRSGLTLAEAEPATTAWFATASMGPSTFGIFDVFPDDAGRQAHLTGPIAAALMAQAAELLAEAPAIEKIDVLAAKLPG